MNVNLFQLITSALFSQGILDIPSFLNRGTHQYMIDIGILHWILISTLLAEYTLTAYKLIWSDIYSIKKKKKIKLIRRKLKRIMTISNNEQHPQLAFVVVAMNSGRESLRTILQLKKTGAKSNSIIYVDDGSNGDPNHSDWGIVQQKWFNWFDYQNLDQIDKQKKEAPPYPPKECELWRNNPMWKSRMKKYEAFTKGDKNITKEDFEWDAAGYLLLRNEIIPQENIFYCKNGKKVGSAHAAIDLLTKSKVSKEVTHIAYVDADVLYLGGYIPLEEIIESNCVAAGINIVPMLHQEKRDSIYHNLTWNSQYLEYKRSMTIGRIFASRTDSTSCVSGAFGIFEIEHLKKTIKKHTGDFYGDDFQRILLIILSKGKVTFFSHLYAETFCPDNFSELQMQRSTKWWPGLYLNLKNMMNILFSRGRKNVTKEMRVDMIYESLFLVDPIRLLFIFWIIIFFNEYQYIALALVIGYLMLDIFVGFYTQKINIKIEKIFNRYGEDSTQHSFDMPMWTTVTGIHMVYRICNMFWVTLGLIHYIEDKFLKTNSIKKIVNHGMNVEKKLHHR